MSTVEMKEKLIDKIRETNDADVLEEVFRLMNVSVPESIYRLNGQQRNAIEESRKQIAEGDYLSNEEADKEIDEWLNE